MHASPPLRLLAPRTRNPSRRGLGATLIGAVERRGRGGRAAEADGLWQAAAERALGRPVHDAEVIVARSSGLRNERTLFVFEGEGHAVGVVKVMADSWKPEWLAREYDLLDALRRCVERDERALAALPEAPLFRGMLDGKHVVVERFDAAGWDTGTGEAGQHLNLLARLQTLTRRPERPWTAEDAQTVLCRSAEAITHLPGRSPSPGLLERVRVELGEAVGASAAMVAVHGDYRRRNLAASSDGVRVFDWKWGVATGHPAFDRWTYDLAELRAAAAAREPDLDERAAASLAAVTADLAVLGVDPRFGRAMLLPVALELITRRRVISGRASDWEHAAPVLLPAIERVLG